MDIVIDAAMGEELEVLTKAERWAGAE